MVIIDRLTRILAGRPAAVFTLAVVIETVWVGMLTLLLLRLLDVL
jgi:hypothetical protein